jgi:hypothetical protein
MLPHISRIILKKFNGLLAIGTKELFRIPIINECWALGWI